jgi:uncharacterized protein YqgC (DUF456 family)
MAYRIKLQPAQLRQSAQQLRQAGSQIQELGGRAVNAYNRMDAESRSASGLGGRVRQAQTRAAALAQEALRLASYLETKANAFKQADQLSVTILDQTVSPQVRALVAMTPSATQTSNLNHKPLITAGVFATAIVSHLVSAQHWNTSYNLAKDLLDFRDAVTNCFRAKKYLTTRPGNAYEHQFFIKGGDKNLRTELGIETNTGNIKVVTGVKNIFHSQNRAVGVHLANNQLHSTVTSGVFWGCVALTVGLSAWNNWETYRHEENATRKIIVGTAVDTTLSVGLGLAGQWGGAALGGTIGAALGGPIGAVIGAQVGGFVGGVVGGYLGDMAADWLKDQTLYKDLLNDPTKTTSTMVSSVKDFGTSVTTKTRDVLVEQSQKVEHAIRNVGAAVSTLFKPRVSLFGRTT